MKPFILTSTLTPEQLNQQWQRYFPFLKLKIYANSIFANEEVENNITLKQISQQAHESTELEVEPDMSVKTFEMAFHAKFGLLAEVFRKSGYTWDDTDYTKSWTLREQNLKGQELSGERG